MTKKKEIFLIPYAHLDTQWRWEYPTTIKKYIKNTLDENFYLFDKYPEHRFNFTGAIRYQMMKDYYPAKYERLKELVKAGKWNFAGTCLDETDALIPSIESLIRNVLYGDKWAKSEFGKSSTDYMLPDCFGFPQNMPSVLNHCGLSGFSTQKLTWGSAVGIPFDLGMWKGPDNSELLCAFNPGSYTSRINSPIYEHEDLLDRLNRLGTERGVWKLFRYYGVGDIGGAPKENSVKNAILSIQNASEADPDLVIKQGAPFEFFSEFTEDEKQNLKRYSGDLLLINHSAGSLTSAAIMKRWNRKNEQMAYAAEVASAMAYAKMGARYPNEKIKAAWFKVIGNQMHDILPGTCTPLAYEYSQNDEVIALSLWSSVLEDAANIIGVHAKGTGNILLFNPLSEPRTEAVDIMLPNSIISKEKEFDSNASFDISLKDSDGNSIPTQVRKDEGVVVTFIATLGAFEWKRYDISINGVNETGELQTGSTMQPGVHIDEFDAYYSLENKKYKVKVSKDGKIESIFDKNINKELLKQPLAYEFQKERPTLYPAWNMDWKDRKKKPFKRIESGGTVSIIENGPVRCSLSISTKYKKSLLIKEISLSQDSEIVEFTERIKWRGTGCSLKLAIKTNMDKPDVVFNWESSRIKRGVNNEKCFEMPSRLWVDIAENDWGISLIEDSKYGYDHPDEDTLRLTLLYTPGVWYLNGYIDQKFQDWGNHTIRYAIYSHSGDYKTTDHHARRFNQPIRAFHIQGNNFESDEGNSIESEDLSLFKVGSLQLGISAVKKAENNDGIVIRGYERYGLPLSTQILFNSDVAQVFQINGREEILNEVEVTNNEFNVELEPNGICSYLIKLKQIPEPSVVEQNSISLNYNTVLIGKNGIKQGIFPAELIPEEIYSGGIRYTLKHKETDKDTEIINNALQANGDIISISKKPGKNETMEGNSAVNGFNFLSILLTAEEDAEFSFEWLDEKNNVIEKVACQVPSLTGYIGLWDTRKWLRTPKHYLKNRRDYIWLNHCTGVKPGYVKRARLEWFTNHIHENGMDQPYKHGYMFTQQLGIPENASAIRLPNDKRLYILAATAFKKKSGFNIKSAQFLRDKFDF